MHGWWLLIPVLSAFTGILVIRLILFVFFRQLLPRHRQAWTASLVQKAATEFISFDQIGQQLTSPENVQKIMPAVEVHVNEFLRVGLPRAFPIIGSFIGERTIGQLKEIFMKELETIFPVVMQGYLGNLQKDIDIEQVIAEKASRLSDRELETLFYQEAGPHLRRVYGLAILTGLAIGGLQLFVLWAAA